jgi:gliding motility-associated lipoprotein GldD
MPATPYFWPMLRLCSVLVLFSLFLVSCRPDTYTPKPRGYARLFLPQRYYRQFDAPGFPYRFQYPAYGRIVKDTTFFGQQPENPYWMNIDFASLGASIYLSYKPITATSPLAKLIEDAHEMSFAAHSKRADFIDERVYSNDQRRVYGILYHAGGNAASAYQFIATDSFRHFVRGALYFNVAPNADSLKPLNEFLKADVVRIMETLEWRN